MTTRIRALLACAIMATTISVASACEAQRAPRPTRPPSDEMDGGGLARIDTTLAFASHGSVELSLIAGSMRVRTWDRNEVHVVATTTGDSRIEFDASSSSLNLEETRSGSGYHHGSRHDRNDSDGTVSYDVTVPAGARATLGAVSGTIDVSGVRGNLEVSGVSGRVDVRDVGSNVSVEGVSGAVTVNNVSGDLRVENVSGPLSVTNVGGTLNAESVSGGITVSGVKGARVRATTVSGELDFTGNITPSGRYEFETHSGRTNLRLGSNASATISVDTFSGSVTNEYPGAVRRAGADSDEDRTSYNYVIGRGDARVRVETFSGRVIISQGNR